MLSAEVTNGFLINIIRQRPPFVSVYHTAVPVLGAENTKIIKTESLDLKSLVGDKRMNKEYLNRIYVNHSMIMFFFFSPNKTMQVLMFPQDTGA